MGRRSKSDVDAQIVTLHRRKLTREAIATALGRAGISMTPSGVTRALDRLGLTKPPKPAKALSRRPPPIPSLPQTCRPIPTTPRTWGFVCVAPASLERAAAQAEADKDVSRIVGAQKAIATLAGVLRSSRRHPSRTSTTARTWSPPPLEGANGSSRSRSGCSENRNDHVTEPRKNKH